MWRIEVHVMTARLCLNWRNVVAYRKVGGLHHWRFGRLGGSVYLKRN